MLFHIERQLDDLCERILLGRVEIPHDVVRLIEMRRAAMHLMKLDDGQIRKPDERRFFGGDDIIDAVFFVAEHFVFEPLRSPLGAVLLKESLMIDAVRPAHKRERPAFYVTQDCRSDLEVILNEFGFDDFFRGEQNLV